MICKCKKTISLLLVTILFLNLFFPAFTLYAKEEEGDKIVKVGWYNSDHFQEGDANSDTKSGYSYEYLQGVSNFTGWEYEYVYGGWSDLYDLFLEGEIDLLAGVSYTEERSSQMNFPSQEMGFESYFIYKASNNDDILGSDPTSLKGKKVGTLRNNLMTVYFEEWMNKSGIECEEVFFNDFETRDRAFENGEIDAVIAVNNNIPSNSGLSPVVMVGQSSYYLAVTKERTDLLEELNRVLTLIKENNPYFTESLQMKYFKNTAVNAALSPEEAKWVDDNYSLKVGYIDDYMPFCGSDKDGKISGVITDIFKTWQEQLNLKNRLEIEYIPYDSYTKMIEDLQQDMIDAVFPVTDNIWRSEQQNIVQTNNLVQSGVYVIYKGEYNDDTTSKIALSDHSPFQKIFAEMYYPDSEIVEVSSAKECLDAVKDGKASCTFFNTGRAEKYLAQNEYELLNRLSINNNTYFCIGVKKGNNVVYSLLERGLALIDKSSMTNAIYKYTDSGIEYSISTFIRNNFSIVLGIAILIIGLICAVAITLAISLKKTKEQKNKELENLKITTRQKEELEKAKVELQNAVTLAEQANFAKTSFLFNMSHDIRTPMNAILGFADLAEKHEDDHEKVQDYIKKIKESGDVLLSILNNVLEMSRIEKGTIFIEEQAWSIEQFTDSMFSMFNEQMVQKGLTFEKKVNVVHNYIYCDPPKIREIFINVIANAYKYTDKGGKVSLIIDELPCDKEGQVLFKITVADTGKGMSEDFLPKLFDEFAREKNSEKNTIEGTGLGLAIVKRLVDLMDGTIEVKSKLNEGSSFIITIPAKIASKDDVTIYAKNEANEDEFKGKRILLAEDNDINAEITETILTEEGFEVERAEDGLICLNKVKENPAHYYDIVLMDIQMPNMNGYQASEAIRSLEDKEKSTIPIIAVTANAFEEDKRQAINSGMNGHISKPIVVRDLIKALANTLGMK